MLFLRFMPLSFLWLIPPNTGFSSMDSLSHLHFAQPNMPVLALAAMALFQLEHELLFLETRFSLWSFTVTGRVCGLCSLYHMMASK